MIEYYHKKEAVIESLRVTIEKFLRARSERSLRKLYHEMENKYGYVMLSGDIELSAILRGMINEAKLIKNFM
jgi:hypothetical protein